MLVVALLASLLAQAEQAPAPAAPAPGPAERAPAPAEPLRPSSASGEAPPAPATPPAPIPPPTATAPPALPPVVSEPEPPPTVNSVSVHVRYAYRLGSGDSRVPNSGLSLGGEFERRLLGSQNGFEIGVAGNFFYDRFAKDVVVTSVGSTGAPESTVGTRTLSQTSFAIMETTGWRYADMRLFIAAGAGISVGYYAEDDFSSHSLSDLMLLARGVFGFDFAIAKRTAAVLRVDYTHTFGNNTYFTMVAPGAATPAFGDLLDAGIGFLVRF